MRLWIWLSLSAVALVVAACGGTQRGDAVAATEANAVSSAAFRGWRVKSLPTRTRDGRVGIAFTGGRSAVVLGGGRLIALRLGARTGLVDTGRAPAGVIDGPVAAGPGRAALLVMRPAAAGRAELAVVLLDAAGQLLSVTPVATVEGPRAVGQAILGASGEGELSVVWHSLERDAVLLASAAPNGSFEAPLTVARARYDAPELDLALAVGPAGHLAVVTNGASGVLSARTRVPGGQLGPAERVGRTRGRDAIAIDVGADGDLLVAWSTVSAGEEAEEGSEDLDNQLAVYAVRRDLQRGRFTAAQRLSSSNPESDEGLPDVAAAWDASGRATVAFHAGRAGRQPGPLQVFTARSRQRFGSGQRLGASSAEPGTDLAAASDGRMLLATRRGVRVHAALRDPGTSSFARLRPLGQPTVADDPVVAFSPDARAAVVVWSSSMTGRDERRASIAVAVHR
jgi:hypothetical protein